MFSSVSHHSSFYHIWRCSLLSLFQYSGLSRYSLSSEKASVSGSDGLTQLHQLTVEMEMWEVLYRTTWILQQRSISAHTQRFYSKLKLSFNRQKKCKIQTDTTEGLKSFVSRSRRGRLKKITISTTYWLSVKSANQMKCVEVSYSSLCLRLTLHYVGCVPVKQNKLRVCSNLFELDFLKKWQP